MTLTSHEVMDVLKDAGIEVTYRKLDYWVRSGVIPLLRDGHPGRKFTPHDVEVVYVVAHLYAMGALRQHAQAASDAMRIRPVDRQHPELLVMTDDLAVVRMVAVHETAMFPFPSKPCWVIPLRSFHEE